VFRVFGGRVPRPGSTPGFTPGSEDDAGARAVPSRFRPIPARSVRRPVPACR